MAQIERRIGIHRVHMATWCSNATTLLLDSTIPASLEKAVVEAGSGQKEGESGVGASKKRVDLDRQ